MKYKNSYQNQEASAALTVFKIDKFLNKSEDFISIPFKHILMKSFQYVNISYFFHKIDYWKKYSRYEDVKPLNINFSLADSNHEGNW